MPEPIVKQDGTEKNDCERNAAKRFVTKFRQDHPHLKVIVTEDSLSSNAPHMETLQSHHMRYLLGVKEGCVEGPTSIMPFCSSRLLRPSEPVV